MRTVYRTLVWKPHEKRSFWKLTHKWEENITMVLRETVCEIWNWTELA
jgi:hypothetical protein